MGMKFRRPAFRLDTQACTGCKTCMVACKDKNDLAEGVRWRRVVEYSGGEWTALPDGTFRQDVFAYYISLSCNHCERPICVEVCPTTAMHQDPNGIVSVDQVKCVGCGYCRWACPYDAPQYQADKGRMSKCDFCRDRLEVGALPACVAACPTRALSVGELDELRQEAGPTMDPLPEEGLTEPGAVFGAHKQGRPAGSRAGRIANPEENRDE